MRYDAVVVGSGPAGLAAAINLKVRNKSFLLFGTQNLSAKLEAAPRIDNYLGFPGISGKQLQQKFTDHLREMDIAITEQQVTVVYNMGDYFSIASNKQVVEATAVIVATGTFTGQLLPGEQEFLGRGVGYCATCDAPLYKGKTVAILGYGDESVHEANFVAELAETVYYIPVRKSALPLVPSIRTIEGKVLEIAGGMKASRLILAEQELAVDGVFILRETIAPVSLVPGIALEGSFIQVDTGMHTNLDGCFAAGDCTGKPHQYMSAVGQGQIAALNAVAYIDKRKANGKAGIGK